MRIHRRSEVEVNKLRWEGCDFIKRVGDALKMFRPGSVPSEPLGNLRVCPWQHVSPFALSNGSLPSFQPYRSPSSRLETIWEPGYKCKFGPPLALLNPAFYSLPPRSNLVRVRALQSLLRPQWLLGLQARILVERRLARVRDSLAVPPSFLGIPLPSLPPVLPPSPIASHHSSLSPTALSDR